MKEVDTFWGVFLCMFVFFFVIFCFLLVFFLPKMVYHRVFLYRSVLCICIYKQIYTNNICRLQCVFCERFISPPPLNSKQSLYKQSDLTIKKNQSKQKHILGLQPFESASDWTAEWRRCDLIKCYHLDSNHTKVRVCHLQLPSCWISYLQPKLPVCSVGWQTLMTSHSPLHTCFHQSEQCPFLKRGPLTRCSWLLIRVWGCVSGARRFECHMEDCPCKSVQKTSGRGRWCN